MVPDTLSIPFSVQSKQVMRVPSERGQTYQRSVPAHSILRAGGDEHGGSRHGGNGLLEGEGLPLAGPVVCLRRAANSTD